LRAIRGSRTFVAELTKCALPLFLFLASAGAQDLRSVQSPDGKLEFQIFIVAPKPGDYERLAYRVLWDRKVALDTSYIGVDIYEQEPLLGEKPGLTSSEQSAQGDYKTLIARYLQEGTTGRRIDVEIRVWNQGLAFRYLFPVTPLQTEFALSDEDTEFAYPEDARTPDGKPVASVEKRQYYGFPWIVQEPGVGWIAVNELPKEGFPKARLVTEQPSVMVTRLDRPTPTTPVVMRASTPLIGPWHVVLLAKDSAGVLESPILKDLSR
jgi:alpha-glucosidase